MGFNIPWRSGKSATGPARPAPTRGFMTEVKPAADSSTLLIQLITEHGLTNVHRIVIQSAISQLARIAAMRLAGDNAHTVLDDVTTQHNLARQDAITQPLLEIISGYENTRQPTPTLANAAASASRSGQLAEEALPPLGD